MEIFFHLFCCYILCTEVGNIMLEHSKGNSQEFFEIPHPNVHISYISPLLTSKPPSASDSVPLHPIPPHSAPYIFPRPKGVVKCDTLELFTQKNYPFPTISRISLDKSPSCLYNIWTYVLFLFGQMPGTRPEKRRLPFQNRPAPGKNSKGVVKRDSLCHKEGFPIAGNSGNEG